MLPNPSFAPKHNKLEIITKKQHSNHKLSIISCIKIVFNWPKWPQIKRLTTG